MEQMTLSYARAQAQEAMEQVADRAGKAQPGWLETAYEYLLAYAHGHRIFCGWMVVQSTLADRGFPQPPNTKAWGAVLNRAAKKGIIRRVGVVPDPNRHCAYVPQWESLVYGG